MRFSKWQALGNDYLLVERAELAVPLTPERVRALCDRHYGVGADGLLEIRSQVGVEAHVEIWNPDGSTAELSGNGTRIAARWLAERIRGEAAKEKEESLRILVCGRLTVAVVSGSSVRMHLGLVHVGANERLDVDGEELELTPVSVGNPHAVLRREPTRRDLLRLGPLIERHARFPQRTNVQLVRVESRSELTVAVWERGAGETLSSGTSAVAAAAAAVRNGWAESPVAVRLPGGEVRVEVVGDTAYLTGPAEEVFRGELPDEPAV